MKAYSYVFDNSYTSYLNVFKEWKMYSDEKWWKVFSFTITMMAGGCVENMQILFSDIAGSIDYIWRSAK